MKVPLYWAPLRLLKQPPKCWKGVFLTEREQSIQAGLHLQLIHTQKKQDFIGIAVSRLRVEIMQEKCAAFSGSVVRVLDLKQNSWNYEKASCCLVPALALVEKLGAKRRQSAQQ